MIKKTEAKKSAGNRPTVAEYLTAQIALRGKAQLEIAREMGYENANIITMLKQGKSGLPLFRIGKLAESLGVDPVYLFTLCMSEYHPETWETMQQYILKQPMVTQNELEILEVVRSSKIPNPKLRTAEEKRMLLDVVSKWRPDNASSED